MRLLKKTALLFPLLLLLLTLVLPASAASGDGVAVYDPAALLTADDKAALAEIRGTHGITLYFISGYNGFTASKIESMLGITDGDDAVVLAVDHNAYYGAEYYYEMFTFGRADSLLSTRRCNAILDNAEVAAIKSGRVGDGAAAFFSLTVSEINRAWRPLWLNALIVGLVAGILTFGGTVLGVFFYYRKKQRGVSYPLERYANLHLTVANDRFVGRSVTRVRVAQPSNGGGRGSSSRGGSRGRR